MQKPKARRRKPVKVKNEIATFDFETDPFLFGREPKPFVAGFYSLEQGYKYFWGQDCAERLLDFFLTLKTPHTIYAHNGGKFDFYFFLDKLQNPLKIINGRIVKSAFGIHTLQDSYAMMPIPLRVYDKDDIDYQKLEANVRDSHREEILKYLKKDCTALFDLVFKFRERFGDRLTIGGTAIAKLKEMHPFDAQRKNHDEKFRPFYFGGRVEAFETGLIRDEWKIYDVNSMYPAVMRNYWHPTGGKYSQAFSGIVDKVGRISGFADAKMYFARIECEQQGAFPVRTKDAPLNFDVPFGEFYVTSHELQAAIASKRVQQIKVLGVWAPDKTIQFAEYVDLYGAEKVSCKKVGDKAGEIFAKLLLNSAYGKFGQSPEHYYDFMIVNGDEPDPEEPWEIFYHEIGKPAIWRKNANATTYYDVATAASITGAARSVLMRALSKSDRAIYCDTDSIICRSLSEDQHDSELGKWKLEAAGNLAAIAGKKMYALFADEKCLKVSSKGVRMTGQEVMRIANGETLQWHNAAPTFSLRGPAKFISRKIAKKV